MSRIRDVGKPAALVSALGMGWGYILLAGSAGVVATGLLLPATKSARHIVTEKQVHDFRHSIGETSAEPAAAQPEQETLPSPTAITGRARAKPISLGMPQSLPSPFGESKKRN